MATELWRRFDGWTVEMQVVGDLVIETNHIPLSTVPRPDPLTYEYMVSVLEAYGYDWESTTET